MLTAAVTLCRGLAQLLMARAATLRTYDREANNLLLALQEFIRRHEKKF